MVAMDMTAASWYVQESGTPSPFEASIRLLWTNSIPLGTTGSADIDWMKLVLDPSASVDVDSISSTIDAVFTFLSKNSPSALSLLGLEPQKIQGEHLAAVLRATYKWRGEIPGWKYSLTIAEAALRKQNLDPNDALFGLL